VSNRKAIAIVAAVWVSITFSRSFAAQQPQAADSSARTTLEGVYSAEQATRGEKTYGMSCLGGCHNAASHKGVTFKQNWAGHQVGELYERIKDTMPDDNPGLLTAKESIEIVSYMLKANGMPAGKEDLGQDKAALAKIKIEMPPATAASSRNR
jgi:hypothetical protein